MQYTYLKTAVLIGGILITSPLALADDKAAIIRGVETCQPASFIMDYAQKFKDLKADQRDTVQMIAVAQLIVSTAIDHLPERVYAKDGDAIVNFQVRPDGHIANFADILSLTQSPKICTFDPKRAGLDITKDGLSWDIHMDIQFLNASGVHSIAVLLDGLRDGRQHYKKVAGRLSFFVPKMTHLMISPLDDEAALWPLAMRKDETLGPLKLGADRLVIEGGAYRLLPVPNPKAMARFAGCNDDS
jgi:hypothetical protein